MVRPEPDGPTSVAAQTEAAAIASGGLVRPESETAPTARAQKEAIDISAGRLQRDESVRTHLHYAGLIALWVFFAVGLGILLVWTYHLVTPESKHFLSLSQRYELQTLLLSALGSSVVTAVGRKWLKAMDNDQ